MKLKFLLPLVLALAILTVSCGNDDNDGPATLPEADRGEQQIIDRDSLLAYLNTHYYNSSNFNDQEVDYTIDDIIITELPKDDNGNYLPLPDPDNNTLLIEDVETKTVTLAETLYEYYILNISKGEGEEPDFTDDVLVNYSGMLEDGTIFDSTANPIIFDLINVIPGWRYSLPNFRTSFGSPKINEDGTVTYNGYGIGVMFIPSGLSYFSQPPAGLPLYANLIFKFELYASEDNDHDGDSILSHLEDLDDDRNVFNDDSDEDGISNFLDPDDDNDGVPTINEDLDGDGDPTNDLNASGVPLYLDPDSRESNQS